MVVVVIGGGAAGFFAAISAKHHHPDAHVVLLEKSDKLLSKVRISGGGRCNVTHNCPEPKKLASFYPRGAKFLRKSFNLFNVRDTIAWFAQHGVDLNTETDGRMFPVTNNSETIVSCLQHAAAELGVLVKLKSGVVRMERSGTQWKLHLLDHQVIVADKVIVTTGGNPKLQGYAWLQELGHSIVQPVPSLFTFNLPDEPIRELMGVVADPARVRLIGTELENIGPLLITHWGFSGPAVLKLSAMGARTLHDIGYDHVVQVNWLGGKNEDAVRKVLLDREGTSHKKKTENADPFGLPKRLWIFLLDKAGIDRDKTWEEVAKKERNRLIDLLTNDHYQMRGKTTFKEEFVTSGGVDLAEVDPLTMASSKASGVYFAGEVLDIDGVTGGFNFQAAWTTGFIAGQLL